MHIITSGPDCTLISEFSTNDLCILSTQSGSYVFGTVWSDVRLQCVIGEIFQFIFSSICFAFFFKKHYGNAFLKKLFWGGKILRSDVHAQTSWKNSK